MSLDLAALLERVEAASGPDREIDGDIFRALGMPLPERFASLAVKLQWDEEQKAFVYPVGEGMQVRFDHPAYTASLDASLALCERKVMARADLSERVRRDAIRGMIALAMKRVPANASILEHLPRALMADLLLAEIEHAALLRSTGRES